MVHLPLCVTVTPLRAAKQDSAESLHHDEEPRRRSAGKLHVPLSADAVSSERGGVVLSGVAVLDFHRTVPPLRPLHAACGKSSDLNIGSIERLAAELVERSEHSMTSEEDSARLGDGGLSAMQEGPSPGRAAGSGRESLSRRGQRLGKRERVEPGVGAGQIVVSEFGAFIGKKSERLVVRQGKDLVQQTPFHEIQSIIVAGPGVSISSDVIQECMEHGIQIDFLTFSGKPYAKLTSPCLTGTVITRREQLLAYHEKRGLRLACALIEGKLRNQQGLLHYFARYRKSEDPPTFEAISEIEGKILQIAGEIASVEGNCVDDVRDRLLSIEGRAGALYWEGIRRLLAGKVEFETREHRGASDPFNSLLNYGYGILYSTVWGAVVLAGLEPFAGFIHTDRPGKPSLCLDLVEEFRQRIVDRTVVSLVSKGTAVKLQDGMLSDQTRHKLIDCIQERLESREAYHGKQHKLRTIIQLQARQIASFLRGETDYKPFVGRW